MGRVKVNEPTVTHAERGIHFVHLCMFYLLLVICVSYFI